MGGNCSQNCCHGNKECKLCGFTHFESEMEVPHVDKIKGNTLFFKGLGRHLNFRFKNEENPMLSDIGTLRKYSILSSMRRSRGYWNRIKSLLNKVVNKYMYDRMNEYIIPQYSIKRSSCNFVVKER